MWQTTETDNYVSITDRIAARRRAERLAQKQEEKEEWEKFRAENPLAATCIEKDAVMLKAIKGFGDQILSR